MKRKSFYNKSLPVALRLAREYATKDGFVLSLPQILHARVVAPSQDKIWSNWYIANSEEDVVTTEQGNKIVIVGHGGLALKTPERIEQAYREGLTVQHAAKFSENEAKDLAKGKLQDGTEFPLIPYKEFLTKSNLPLVYGVVLDFNKAKKTKSAYQKFEGIYDNPLAIARAGGEEQLKLYLDRAKQHYGAKYYGQGHGLEGIDADQAQGRVLYIDDDVYYGLDGFNFLDSDGRVLAVAPEAQSVEKNLESKIQKRDT